MTPSSAASPLALKSPARKRVLLVQGNAPWQPNGGGVFMEEMCAHSPHEFFHLAIGLEGREYDIPPGFSREVVQLRSRDGVIGLGAARRLLPSISRDLEWLWLRPWQLRQRLKEAAPKLREFGIDHIVFFLNSLEVSLISRPLLDLLPVPYSTMEWDILEDGLQGASGFGARVCSLQAEALRDLRAGAANRGVASEGMANYYTEEWGLDSLVLRQTIPPLNRSRESSAGDDVIVDLGGSMYAPVEFSALLQAFELLNWRIADRHVRLRVVGKQPEGVALPVEHTEVTGWVPFDRSLELIAEGSIGYCPLWFSEDRRRLTETSFPSKFVSYMTTGIPILYHGPATGTPAGFMRRYPVGINCASLDPGDIADCLVRLATDEPLRERARQAVDDAVAHEFGPHVLSARLATFFSSTKESLA